MQHALYKQASAAHMQARQWHLEPATLMYKNMLDWRKQEGVGAGFCSRQAMYVDATWGLRVAGKMLWDQKPVQASQLSRSCKRNQRR